MTPGYAVVDLETTGFNAGGRDRIVEIGVVHVSADGHIEDEWDTLVNPHRDVGPVHVHGIAARDVLEAPDLADVAPFLLDALDGRVFVAHNAAFDLRFLSARLDALGYPLDDGTPCVCTMRWSAHLLAGARSRKLGDCCHAAGVAYEHAHSALWHAHATAELLCAYLRTTELRPPWQTELHACASYRWPHHQRCSCPPSFAHRSKGEQAVDAWLDGLTSQLPRHLDPTVESYLACLDAALLDRHISVHESQELLGLASVLGLDRARLTGLHRQYLEQLAAAAVADSVITPDEHADLERVARMLGLHPDEVEQALLEAALAGPPTVVPRFRLEPGDRVVLTGDMRRPRAEWELLVAEAGLALGGVTRGTKVVVAADPDSLSGKAAKARGFGIPIITEAAFEDLFREFLTR